MNLYPKHELEMNNVLSRICPKRNALVRHGAFQSRFRNVLSVDAEQNNVLYLCQSYLLRVENGTNEPSSVRSGNFAAPTGLVGLPALWC